MTQKDKTQKDKIRMLKDFVLMQQAFASQMWFAKEWDIPLDIVIKLNCVVLLDECYKKPAFTFYK